MEVEAFVSARKTNRFVYLQEGTTGAPWQGIHVDAGALVGSATSGPIVGQKVKVRGVFESRFGTDQITAASILVTDPTRSAMQPLAVTPADIASASGGQAFESLLVSIGASTILGGPSTLPLFEFEIEGAIRIDDFIFARFGEPQTCGAEACVYPPAAFVDGTSFRSITGIVGPFRAQRMLYPRGAAGCTMGACDDLVR